MDLTRLALRVRPAVDEASHSLLDRLAIRHGCDSVAAFLDSVPSEIVTPLSRLGRMSGPSLSVWHARSAQGAHIEFANKQMLLHSVSKDIVESECSAKRDKAFSIRKKICCSCIKEDLTTRTGPANLRTFRRNWWDLSAVSTCPFHMVYLTKACPLCGTRIDKTLITPRHCRCGFDFSEAAMTNVNQVDIVADYYLVGRISSRILGTNELLDQMPLRIAASCMAHVGRLGLLGLKAPIDATTSPHGCVKVLSVGYEALANGQVGLLKFLDKITDIKNEHRYLSVASRYGSLYRWLNLSKHESLDQIKGIVLQHAANNFACSGRRTLFGRERIQASHITFGAAVKKWGIKYKQAYCIARSLGIRLNDEVTLKTPITTEDYKLVSAWLACHLHSADAMTLLNLKPHVFDNIVKAGILSKAYLCFPGRFSYYSSVDVVRLLNDACQAAPSFAEAPVRCVGLLEAARSHGAVVGVLKGLLDRSIKAIGILQSCGGLPAILVGIDALEEARRVN